MDAAMRPDAPAHPIEDLHELERLSSQVGDRESIRLLSRALMATFVGLLLLGVSVKLFFDSRRFPYWGFAVAALDMVAWVTAGICFVRSSIARRGEAALVERLRQARERLGIVARDSEWRL